MKEKQTIGIVLIVAMLVVTVGVVVAMMLAGQKETYYGYMKDDTTAEKVVSESEKTVETNVKIPTDDDFRPEKGDFVKLVAKKMSHMYILRKDCVT